MKELDTLRLKLSYLTFAPLELTGVEWYSKEELIRMAQGKHPDYSLPDYATMLCTRIRQANFHHAQLKLAISQFKALKNQALGEGTSRLVRKFEKGKVPRAMRKKITAAISIFEVDATDKGALDTAVEAIDDTIKELESCDKTLMERSGLLRKQLERVQNLLREQGIKVDLKLWQLELPRKDRGVNLHEEE